MSEKLQEEKQIAISWSDYNKYGCPNCGCASTHNTGCQGGGTVPSQCFECEHQFVILADGMEKSTIGFGEGKDQNQENIFYYPLLTKHPREGTPKHVYVRPDLRPEYGEYYNPRGIGYDLAAFVKSKEAGQRVVEMYQEIFKEFEDKEKLKDLFGSTECSAWLDYRPNEPTWIQVKLDYGSKRRMYALTCLISTNNNIITKEIIKEALNIKWTLLNIWKYEGVNAIYSMFNFNTIKEVVGQVENVLHPCNNIKSIKGISMQNQLLYYGTFIDLLRFFEVYNDKIKNERFIEKSKERIICSLRLLNDYITSDNFDIGEDYNAPYYSVRQQYIADGKKIIAEMLQADFE